MNSEHPPTRASQQAVEAVEEKGMIEYRVRNIERFEVTRYSENIERTQGGVETVASNLTEREANDIAGAMYERSRSMGHEVEVEYADPDHHRGPDA